MMRSVCFLVLLAFAGCVAAEPEPSAQDEYEDFSLSVAETTTGIGFEEIADVRRHECNRTECNEYCQREVEFAEPDQILVCRWDEPLTGYSDLVFGTVFSVLHLRDDKIVQRSIEVIYTGP